MRFPCDADGHVEFDDFSDRCCGNYHHAWAAVGREFSAPSLPRHSRLSESRVLQRTEEIFSLG